MSSERVTITQRRQFAAAAAAIGEWVNVLARPEEGTEVRINGVVGKLYYRGSWNRIKNSDAKAQGWENGKVKIRAEKIRAEYDSDPTHHRDASYDDNCEACEQKKHELAALKHELAALEKPDTSILQKLFTLIQQRQAVDRIVLEKFGKMQEIIQKTNHN